MISHVSPPPYCSLCVQDVPCRCVVWQRPGAAQLAEPCMHRRHPLHCNPRRPMHGHMHACVLERPLAVAGPRRWVPFRLSRDHSTAHTQHALPGTRWMTSLTPMGPYGWHHKGTSSCPLNGTSKRCPQLEPCSPPAVDCTCAYARGFDRRCSAILRPALPPDRSGGSPTCAPAPA